MITRTTYRRPLPGSPPFFFHPPSPAPNKDKTVQRSGLSLPCVVQMQNTCPINTRSSRFRACIFPLYQTLYLAFYSCPPPPHTWHEFGYLSHAISVLEARGGTRGFDFRNVSGPSRCAPLSWMAAQGSETDSVRSVGVYSRLRIPWSPRPRWRLGARKKNGMRSPSEIGYMKMLARLRHLH